MNNHHKRRIKRKVYRQLGWPMKGRGFYSMIKRWPSFFIMYDLVAIRPMTAPIGQVFI